MTLTRLLAAVVTDDVGAARLLLTADPALAAAALDAGMTRATPSLGWFPSITHGTYAGDTALHLAAAAHATELVGLLLDAGANVAATNRRGATALHYAVDGGPTLDTWDPHAQTDVVTQLLAAGADPAALDRNGVAPLHRAIRNRCTPAVAALLAAGADPSLPNRAGSTPLDLARGTTGRGGTGTQAAKLEQQAIIELLNAALR